MTQATQVVTIQNNDIVQFEHDINNALFDLSEYLIVDIKYNTIYIGEHTVIHSALIIYKWDPEGGNNLSKIYWVSIATRTGDESGMGKNVIEKIFAKKSKLKHFLEQEGYCKAAKNQYIKIDDELIYEAAVEKVKMK